jgi:hypothetical protein
MGESHHKASLREFVPRHSLRLDGELEHGGCVIKSPGTCEGFSG